MLHGSPAQLDARPAAAAARRAAPSRSAARRYVVGRAERRHDPRPVAARAAPSARRPSRGRRSCCASAPPRCTPGSSSATPNPRLRGWRGAAVGVARDRRGASSSAAGRGTRGRSSPAACARARRRRSRPRVRDATLLGGTVVDLLAREQGDAAAVAFVRQAGAEGASAEDALRAAFDGRALHHTEARLASPPRPLGRRGPRHPAGPVRTGRWVMSLKLRRSKRPPGMTIRRLIEPLSEWMNANGRLPVARRHSSPMIPPWTTAAAVASGPGLGDDPVQAGADAGLDRLGRLAAGDDVPALLLERTPDERVALHRAQAVLAALPLAQAHLGELRHDDGLEAGRARPAARRSAPCAQRRDEEPGEPLARQALGDGARPARALRSASGGSPRPSTSGNGTPSTAGARARGGRARPRSRRPGG